MKKFLTMAVVSVCALTGLSACGEQKITQQVTIDKSLLEVLQGKAGPKDGATATVNPKPTAPPSSTPASSEPEPTFGSDENAIFAVIKANANALNSQDLNSYATTLHPESQITRYMPDIFWLLVQAQTRYQINDLEVDEQNDSVASVWVDRSTSDISGTIEQDIIYTLKKSGSSWKIYFMEVENGDG